MKNFLAGFLVADCLPINVVVRPLLLFAFRFYVAFVFLKSGLTKVDDSFKVTQSTIDLFAYEYNVPLLSPEVAAYMAAYAELILPVLLILGLFARPAALGLFILNAVAMYALSQTDFASAAGHWQHVVWGTMLAAIFAFGPGKASLDQWLSDKLFEKEANLGLAIGSVAVLSGVGYFLATKFL